MTPIETYAPSQRMPLWARLLGARYWHGDSTAQTKIGEISTRSRQLALEIGAHESPHLMVALVFFTWFIPLPQSWIRFFPGDCGMERTRYGFSWRWGQDWGGAPLFLHWGRHGKIISMPWALEHIRTDYLGDDMQWWDDRAEPSMFEFRSRYSNRRHRYTGSVGPAKWSEVHPYRYLLRSGEVQQVNATITRRRATHGRLWFGRGPVSRWLRRVMPKRVFESIDVAFDGEVGERSGSWKGGTIGCSYDMRPGESPRACLARMQGERRFR